MRGEGGAWVLGGGLWVCGMGCYDREGKRGGFRVIYTRGGALGKKGIFHLSDISFFPKFRTSNIFQAFTFSKWKLGVPGTADSAAAGSVSSLVPPACPVPVPVPVPVSSSNTPDLAPSSTATMSSSTQPVVFFKPGRICVKTWSSS